MNRVYRFEMAAAWDFYVPRASSPVACRVEGAQGPDFVKGGFVAPGTVLPRAELRPGLFSDAGATVHRLDESYSNLCSWSARGAGNPQGALFVWASGPRFAGPRWRYSVSGGGGRTRDEEGECA